MTTREEKREVKVQWCPQHGYPLPCDKCGLKAYDEEGTKMLQRREEIREGIDEIIKDVLRCFKRGEWIDTATVTKKIQEYEASQGVVLKVKGESPDCDFCHGKGVATFEATSGYMQTYESSCLKCNGTGKDYSGYSATEPLIKEEK